jgi:hypothetical protein
MDNTDVSISKNIDEELLNLVLKVANQIFIESSFNFQRAIAARILGKQYGNFRVLNIDDFLADIVCNGKQWKEYKKNVRQLDYFIESASLTLYILVEDQRFEDANELLSLINNTESILQKRGYRFNNIYVEIMKWVTKEMKTNYSQPKDIIQSSSDYYEIIKVIINYNEILDDHKILQTMYSARKLILDMFEEKEWDVSLLYFVWKLTELYSIKLPLKDQETFIIWRYRKNLFIYYIIRFMPSILIAIIDIIRYYLTNEPPILLLFSLIIPFIDRHLQQIEKLRDHWSYYVRIKFLLEKDRQRLKKLKVFR